MKGNFEYERLKKSTEMGHERNERNERNENENKPHSSLDICLCGSAPSLKLLINLSGGSNMRSSSNMVGST